MIRFRWSDATPSDRPVFLLGSGRCGSTLLQSILNSNREFLIWGEHNGFLRQLAEAYYGAAHPHFPAADSLGIREREKRLRDPDRWIAWDNLCSRDDFRNGFRTFLRSIFADPEGKCPRWGFKEIRYALDSDDQSLRLLAEFFPEGRFVILIRNPIQTVFSMIAHWVLVEPGVSLGAAEMDEQILSRTVTWTEQYMQLGAFSEAHAPRCTSVRYEELALSGDVRGLGRFPGIFVFRLPGASSAGARRRQQDRCRGWLASGADGAASAARGGDCTARAASIRSRRERSGNALERRGPVGACAAARYTINSPRNEDLGRDHHLQRRTEHRDGRSKACGAATKSWWWTAARRIAPWSWPPSWARA